VLSVAFMLLCQHHCGRETRTPQNQEIQHVLHADGRKSLYLNSGLFLVAWWTFFLPRKLQRTSRTSLFSFRGSLVAKSVASRTSILTGKIGTRDSKTGIIFTRLGTRKICAIWIYQQQSLKAKTINPRVALC